MNPQMPGNSVLLQAMRNVAVHDTPERREILYGLLLDATLLAITPEPAPAPGDDQGDKPLRLVTAADARGSLLPLFTDVVAIRLWYPDAKGYVPLPARDVFAHTTATNPCRIAINIGSDIRGVLTPAEVDALAHGRIPDSKAELLTEAATLSIGRPTEPPAAEAIDTLRDLLASEPAVTRAWHFGIERDYLFTSYGVALRFAEGVTAEQRDRVMRSVVHEAGRRAPALASFLFQVATPELVTQLERGAGEEFFRRS